jgi:tetratricopeptide (TPR) repeat protein
MRKNLKFRYVPIVLIVLISIALYLNSLNNSFHFDDFSSIVENPYIRNLRDIPLFLKGLEVQTTWFRVLPTLSFAMNYHFHGLNVFGYHLVNLILHIFSGILVYLISRNLFILGFKRTENPSEGTTKEGDKRINLLSLLSAMIFIAHPIQVNTVTYIAERNEGLASFFYLLCFFLFLKGSLAQGWKKFLFFTGAGFSFFCSIFSKEIGFTLPIILILCDLLFICKRKEEIFKRLKIYLPVFVFLTTYISFFLGGGILRLLTKGSEGMRWTPWENLLTQSNVIIQYIKLLLLPLPRWLNVDHDFQISKSLLEYPTWLSAAIILILLISATYLIRKNRLIPISVYSFFIILAPTSSLIPIWDIMVEYRLYLPLFSYALIASIGLYYLHNLFSRRFSKKVGASMIWGIAILILTFYSVTTIERNRIFKDEVTLWSDAAKKSPDKIRPKVNLVSAYQNHGLYDQAIATSLEVLEKDPRNYEIYTKMGISYTLMGEYDKAMEKLITSIQIENNNPNAHNNLGVIYLEKKEFDRAIAEFKQALSYLPDYAEAYNNLAKALAIKGLLDEAIKEEREAIRIDPSTEEYQFNLAKLYENKGLIKEAVTAYKEALKLNQRFFEGHYYLGELYTRIENYREAISEFEKALRIRPNSGKTYFMLGVNFIKAGDKEKAIGSLQKALQYASNEKDRKGIESILSKLQFIP